MITPVFLRIMISVFIAEAIVMAVIHQFGPNSFWNIVFDPILLTALTTPMVYLFVVKPLSAAIKRHEQAEEALRLSKEALHRAHDEMEIRVKDRTAELENANRELKAEIAERQRLEWEVLDIGTREQRRIGQELHDGLGQELTGLSYLAASLHHKMQAAGSPEGETAAELAKGIPRALGQVQTIARGLIPLEIDAENLEPALQVLASNIEERTGIACSFQSSGPLKVQDQDVAVQLYRIAQEAVTNAVKHGQARSIALTTRADAGRITLEIRDDGVGVSTEAEKASGSGLHIMRYRARVLGGTLDVKSVADGGTLVTCSLPR